MSFLDFETFDHVLATPITSAVPTRYERKELAASSTKTPQAVRTLNPLNRSAAKSGGSKSGGKKTPGADRYISNRDGMNDAHLVCAFDLENEVPQAEEGKSEYNSHLAQSLFSGDDLGSKILSFSQKAPLPTDAYSVKNTVSSNRDAVKKPQRQISTIPEKVLDAPGLVDDYYLNVLDVSSQNVMSIALGNTVYAFNLSTGAVDQVCTLSNPEDIITSVSFTSDGAHLAVGTSNSEVQLWSLERKKQLRSLKGHTARVSSLAWNGHILSTGSRDNNIMNHDVRIPQHRIATLSSHQQEVVQLKWSPDGTQLASGGNDNMVMLWNSTQESPLRVFADSSAAVKALAWCPWQSNLLATGSGSADRHIRFYNTSTGALLNSIDTQSQVCSLQWSKTEKELISSHGFSQNQISVWKYPTLVKVADLHSHKSRVLHTGLSADGTTVISAAADESICFWKIWEQQPTSATSAASAAAAKKVVSNMHIR